MKYRTKKELYLQKLSKMKKSANLTQTKRQLTIEIKELKAYILDMLSTRRNNEDTWWYLGTLRSKYTIQRLENELKTLTQKRKSLNN